jgi:hypothetical protein
MSSRSVARTVGHECILRKLSDSTKDVIAAGIPEMFELLGGSCLVEAGAAGTIRAAIGQKLNPALYEPSYDSACAPKLP